MGSRTLLRVGLDHDSRQSCCERVGGINLTFVNGVPISVGCQTKLQDGAVLAIYVDSILSEGMQSVHTAEARHQCFAFMFRTSPPEAWLESRLQLVSLQRPSLSVKLDANDVWLSQLGPSLVMGDYESTQARIFRAVADRQWLVEALGAFGCFLNEL